MPDPLTRSEANLYDVYTVLGDLRKEDRDELAALGYTSGHHMAAQLIEDHADVFTYRGPDGEPLALYGVTPDRHLPNAGRPWLVMRPLAPVDRDLFIIQSHVIVGELGRGYDILFNLKWDGNRHHIPWLEKLGFTVIRTLSFGGELFHEFIRIVPK